MTKASLGSLSMALLSASCGNWPRATARCAAILLVAACSVTQTVVTTPTPENIQSYFSDHSYATLRVTDSTGRKRWIYESRLRGDTLRGLRNATTRWDSISVPLRGVSEVAAAQFSAPRTLGLAGVLAAIVGLIALTAPDPVY